MLRWMSFEITVNGHATAVGADVPSHTTLLQWLRATGKTGTKEGCAEGDCGACSVALVDTNAHGERTFRAVNACITLLPMVAGREIVTVEGVSFPEGLHPVQQAMVERYGSQCGFCTPGFVVSMFEAYYRKDLVDAGGDARAKIGDQLNGNLCRCTGYRPIRDAMLDALAAKPKADDLFQLRLAKSATAIPKLDYRTDEQTFLRPTTLDELLAIKAEHGTKAELVAARPRSAFTSTRRTGATRSSSRRRGSPSSPRSRRTRTSGVSAATHRSRRSRRLSRGSIR